MARKLYDAVCTDPECGTEQTDVFSRGPDANGHLEGCACEVCESPMRARLIAAVGMHRFDVDALTGPGGMQVDFAGGTEEGRPIKGLHGSDVGATLAGAVRAGHLRITSVTPVETPSGLSGNVIRTENA